MKAFRTFLFVLLAVLAAGSAFAQKTRIQAPLGSATTGTWTYNQTFALAGGPSSFGGMRFNVLLPSGYNPSLFTYPLLISGSGLDQGMNGSTYPVDGATFVSRVEGDSLLFNTVAFRTAHPAIVILVQCDQTLDLMGATFDSNCGGYADAANTSWNEQAISGITQAAIANTLPGFNLSVDSTRVYCAGPSLMGIGCLAQMVDNNKQNPQGLALFTAGVGFSAQLTRSLPNSAVFPRMAAVPWLEICAPGDNPCNYSLPAWDSPSPYPNNTSYPVKSTYDSGGVAAIEAGTSKLYVINTSSGTAYGTFGCMNADGCDGTAIYAWLFSQISAPGQFSVLGANVLQPNGSVFQGRGMAIDDSEIPGAVTNAQAQPLTSLFPKVNFMRLAMDLNGGSCSNAYNWNIDLPANFTNQIAWLTGQGIVVVVENHAFPQTCSVQTGAALTSEVAWYSAWAAAYVNNPLVWFGTPNEPLVNNEVGLQTAVTTEQVAIYNGIRATGNSSIIELEEVAGGPAYVLGTSCSSGACLNPASAYTTMTNVTWGPHDYAYCCGGQSSLIPVATIVSTIQANNLLAQQFSTADSAKPPVGIFEYGPSTDGSTYDVSGNNLTTAVQQLGLSTLAWNYFSGDCCNNTTNGSNSGLTSPFGTNTATYIAAGQGPVAPKPVVTAPASVTTTVSTVTAVPVSATDSAFPGDTQTFSGTSTGSGTLTGTGATGNGTGTISFTGSLTALNTMLGTITFRDAVVENPTLTFSVTDQHALNGSAMTAVNVLSGSVSPNCTIITTVGPSIVSAGPPSATWSINSAGQVVVNGTADATTNSVIELAYVGGLVWQENTGLNWYSKSKPSDTWSAGTTTNPTTSCGSLSISAPPSLAVTLGVVTPVPGVSVGDPAFPGDQIGLVATETSPGTLSATGATGSGTGTVSACLALGALNTLLGTLTTTVPSAFAGAGSISYSVFDQHTNTAAATTTVTTSGAVASPNFTVTRSLGVPITDALGEQFELTATGCTGTNGAPCITVNTGSGFVIDQTTGGVVELAWVNGNIWQLNTLGNWYDKANAAATWAGPTKRSPINKPKHPVRR